MPVLKQYQTTPAMREAIVLDLGDIGAQAARIRAAAETQAQQIIAAAEDKAERLAREREAEAAQRGYAEGLERGLAEGREQGHAEALSQSAEQLRQLTEAWSQVVTEWESQRVEMEREARQSVLNFALSAAEKLVHRVIEVDETVIIDQAGHALSLVLSAQNATVRVHPVDRPLLNDALPQLLDELNEVQHIELVEDASITPGGCVVAFGQGTIDATIERQLGRLIDMILPAADESPERAEEPESSAIVREQRGKPDAQSGSSAGVDPDTIAPVYEITEEGLVEASGKPQVGGPTAVPADETVDGNEQNETGESDEPGEPNAADGGV